jgi:hypothetical protein
MQTIGEFSVAKREKGHGREVMEVMEVREVMKVMKVMKVLSGE